MRQKRRKIVFISHQETVRRDIQHRHGNAAREDKCNDEVEDFFLYILVFITTHPVCGIGRDAFPMTLMVVWRFPVRTANLEYLTNMGEKFSSTNSLPFFVRSYSFHTLIRLLMYQRLEYHLNLKLVPLRHYHHHYLMIRLLAG